MRLAGSILASILLTCVFLAAQPTASATFKGRLTAQPESLQYPDGSPFAWRGLASFRLVELASRGRTTEIERYLAWAAAHDVTIVRVLSMAKHLFVLSPDAGRRALPALLRAAKRHGLYVEVVALADTGAYDFDLDRHVRAIGAIAAQHDNAIVEIANEPDHPTQRKELADPARLLALARLIPGAVPVALGSGADAIYAAATQRANTYVTEHFARTDGDAGWRPHLALRHATLLREAYKRFVVDDEPIGAAAASKAGSRDADPARWFGRGLLVRVLKIGGTFHSDAGLRAAIPAGAELACFEAWRQGLLYLPGGIDARAIVFDAGETMPDDLARAPVASFDRTTAVDVFSVVDGATGWAIAIGVSGDPQVRLREGWRVMRVEKRDRVWIQHLAR